MSKKYDRMRKNLERETKATIIDQLLEVREELDALKNPPRIFPEDYHNVLSFDRPWENERAREVRARELFAEFDVDREALEDLEVSDDEEERCMDIPF